MCLVRRQEAPLALCQPCCPHGLALPLCDSSILRSGRQREQAREREREQSQAQGSCVSNRVCVCVCTHVLCCFDMVSPDMCTLLCPAGQPIRTTHWWMWSKAPAMPSPDFWHLSLFLVHTIHVFKSVYLESANIFYDIFYFNFQWSVILIA